MLRITPAPHIFSKVSVKRIMWSVVWALTPALVYSIYIFGIRVLFLLFLSIASAMGSEFLFEKITKRKITIMDGSAVITGFLILFNISPNSPWWFPVVGSTFSILIAKQLFGGIGYNIFNPALIGRAFLMASWPKLMTGNWVPPKSGTLSGLPSQFLDGISQATPLTLLKVNPTSSVVESLNSTYMIKSLFFGKVGGCVGETSALLLLVGALYLFIMRIADWRISLGYIGSIFALSGIFYFSGLTPVNPLFHILSGGVMLGGLFMATDPVTSPVTLKGRWIFGIGGGLICVLIRIWGGYPEGVSYSILIMNMFVPLLDRISERKIFGR
ncbi:MAG: RnfABCDGE type electron transport complex subunit D [candidate division WOR-3 bacterium]